MNRNSISYRPILCHHAPGAGLAAGGGHAARPAPASRASGVAAMETTTAAFVRFDQKVSHGGSQ
jgi:hypothetical protein